MLILLVLNARLLLLLILRTILILLILEANLLLLVLMELLNLLISILNRLNGWLLNLASFFTWGIRNLVWWMHNLRSVVSGVSSTAWQLFGITFHLILGPLLVRPRPYGNLVLVPQQTVLKELLFSVQERSNSLFVFDARYHRTVVLGQRGFL